MSTLKVPDSAAQAALKATASGGNLVKSGSLSSLRKSASAQSLVDAAKVVAKSAVITKAATVAGRKSGMTALLSAGGMACYTTALGVARKWNPEYLDPVSANQINQDPNICMNVHAFLPFREQTSLDKVRDTFSVFPETYARFREVVVLQGWMMWPYWEEAPNFDVNDHLVELAEEFDEKKVQEYVSKSLSIGLPLDKPLWRVTLFKNYRHDDGVLGSALLFKYHHCIGDGFSILRVVMSAHQDFESLPKKTKKEPVQKMHRPGDVRKKVFKALSVGGKFATAGGKLVATQDDKPSVIKSSVLLKGSDPRIARCKTTGVSVPQASELAKKHNGTINDVLLSAFSGALRNFNKGKGVPDQNLVDPLTVVWVALKPLSEIYQAKTREDLISVGEPGNTSLGCVYIRLPVSDDQGLRGGNAADRVQMVKKRISQLKGSPEPILAHGLTGFFGLLPKAISNPIWNLTSNKVSVSFSNVPGPQQALPWCGATADRCAFWVPPVGTISIFVTLATMDKHITLSIAVDPAVFSEEDAEFIVNNFDKELQAMYDNSPNVQPASKL